MGPYGGLSLRGGQQAALPLIGTWNLERMQDAVGFLNAFNCKFTTESSSERKLVSRLRFERIVVMTLWPYFLAHPVE